MKRISLFFAAAAVMAFFVSCEKQDGDSLTGTTWKSRNDSGIGAWSELSFTSTHATYTFSTETGFAWGYSGTYTYDPPTVTMTIASDGFLHGFKNIGTVRRKTMNIDMHHSDDIVLVTEFRKQ
jgi:hypothetical protein